MLRDIVLVPHLCERNLAHDLLAKQMLLPSDVSSLGLQTWQC